MVADLSGQFDRLKCSQIGFSSQFYSLFPKIRFLKHVSETPLLYLCNIYEFNVILEFIFINSGLVAHDYNTY